MGEWKKIILGDILTESKIENLLSLCDPLETQITTNQTHSGQLMQAVLKEAFRQSEAE